jgi:hypothetical protein
MISGHPGVDAGVNALELCDEVRAQILEVTLAHAESSALRRSSPS